MRINERMPGVSLVLGILTDEHLDNAFPSLETFDEDVGRLQLMRSSVLLDLHLDQLTVYSNIAKDILRTDS